MKIFYAVQATGNGHISRAIEILPHLKKYGTVDVFLSGSNSNLLIGDDVKYRSKGLSFYYSGNGGLKYAKTIASFRPYHLYKEIQQLPVEKYDLIINDFECVTALACAKKKVKSIGFGHQASFVSNNTPRSENKKWLGEFILKNYAKATAYAGLHFQRYDDFILPPIIKNDIWHGSTSNKGHITVYLMAYTNDALQKVFGAFRDFQFHIFSKDIAEKKAVNNITFFPISKEAFNNSFLNCHGIITGAGFETPAEAIYLQKKLLAMPIKGQYEQQCNAAALGKLGIAIFKELNEQFANIFYNWVYATTTGITLSTKETNLLVEEMMTIAEKVMN